MTPARPIAMNARFIYQTHKWLAVAVVAATLCWFISGVIMVLPGSWRTLSPNLTPQRYIHGGSCAP